MKRTLVAAALVCAVLVTTTAMAGSAPPRSRTPSVNGLDTPLLTASPNAVQPFRLDRRQAYNCDQDHDYTDEQRAFDSGLMDRFVETVGRPTAPPTDGCDYGHGAGLVMGYFDGDEVDRADVRNPTATSATREGGRPHPRRTRATSATSSAATTSPGAGSRAASPSARSRTRRRPACRRRRRTTSRTTSRSSTTARPPNPAHTPPASPAEVGHDGPADHQYDLTDFWTAVDRGSMPSVSFLKAPAYARRDYVDHSVTDQSSILRFIEDNWSLGRIGDASFDEVAGSLHGLFDFGGHGHGFGSRRLILDPATGEPEEP